MSARKSSAIGSEQLTIELCRKYLENHFGLTLPPEAVERIEHCRNYLDRKVEEVDKPIYGVTAGFGSLCNRIVSPDQLTKLQENIVESHVCSCSDEVAASIIRLMLLLKAHALRIGNSGIQIETVQHIVGMLNADVLPVVYDRGSLGASGNLAPLANLFLPLIGYGEVRYKGRKLPSCEVLGEFGRKLIKLKSKEGLALLNGTQSMSSYSVYALIQVKCPKLAADWYVTLSLKAFVGLDAPYGDRLRQIRPHQGQMQVAAHMRELLKGSEMIAKPKSQVQGPYSSHCVPQVHGASRDAIAYARSIVEAKINSVTDDPTISPDDDMAVSGGNFHGQPLAIVYNFLTIALAELDSISERHIAQLILGLRDLPEFLAVNPGFSSSFVIPQYATAAIISQNKMYCHSAASDSIVSSSGQGGHVSMGANAATKLMPLIVNLHRLFGIELLNATQAIEFHHPMETLERLGGLFTGFRKVCPRVEGDVVMCGQMNEAEELIRTFPFE